MKTESWNEQMIKSDVHSVSGLIGKKTSFFAEYKIPVMGLVTIVALFSVGIPAFKYYKSSRVESFSEGFYKASTSLQKEELYRDLINQFDSLPASQLAVLELVDHLSANQRHDEAMQVLDDHLIKVSNSDLLSTYLVLQKFKLAFQNQKEAEAYGVLKDHRDQILPAFRTRADLFRVKGLISINQKAEAKKILDEILAIDSSEKENSEYNPEVTDEAKRYAKWLELGVI